MLNHLVSFQVGLARKVMEKRPWQRLVPQQSVILSENKENAEYKVAAVSQDGDFMTVYLPYGRKINISTAKLQGKILLG